MVEWYLSGIEWFEGDFDNGGCPPDVDPPLPHLPQSKWPVVLARTSLRLDRFLQLLVPGNCWIGIDVEYLLWLFTIRARVCRLAKVSMDPRQLDDTKDHTEKATILWKERFQEELTPLKLITDALNSLAVVNTGLLAFSGAALYYSKLPQLPMLLAVATACYSLLVVLVARQRFPVLSAPRMPDINEIVKDIGDRGTTLEMREMFISTVQAEARAYNTILIVDRKRKAHSRANLVTGLTFFWIISVAFYTFALHFQ